MLSWVRREGVSGHKRVAVARLRSEMFLKGGLKRSINKGVQMEFMVINEVEGSNPQKVNVEPKAKDELN